MKLNENGILKYKGLSEVGITDSLDGFWKMNDDTLDYSGNGNHGTIVGPIVSGGLKDLAYDFDGTDDYIDLNYGLGLNPFTSPMTITQWVKSNTTSESHITISTNQSADDRLYMGHVASKWAMGVGATPWTGLGSISTTDEWTFLTLTLDSGVAKLYANGLLSATINYTTFTTFRDFHVGQHGVGANSWDGKITDTRVYGKVLTEEEIFIQYKYGLSNFGMQLHSSGTLYLNKEIDETL